MILHARPGYEIVQGLAALPGVGDVQVYGAVCCVHGGVKRGAEPASGYSWSNSNIFRVTP
jgi:hypothetical protein